MVKKYFSGNRKFLSSIAVVIIAIVALGIIFTGYLLNFLQVIL